MAFFARSVSDEDWIQLARPIFAEALVSASFLNQAVQEQDVEGQVSASRAILEWYPTLEEAIRKGAPPTSLGAKDARNSLQLSLRGYIDSARQALVLYKDGSGKSEVEKGKTGSPQTSHLGTYYEIVAKAGSHFEAARTFFTRPAAGLDRQTSPD